jgi:nifR3 family TIM-barrel protein
MGSAKGMFYGNENTSALLHQNPEERGRTAVQIFGSEPEIIGEVVGRSEFDDFAVIDINMGCPVPKIVKNGEGSFLMKNPYLVKEIVKSAVKGAKGKPVTVKFRAGFSPDDKNAPDVAVACEEGGASLVTVHGRTRDAYYSGEVDYDTIRKVKDSVKIPVCGNGSVVDRESYLKMKEKGGVDYVMVARGAIGRPYIFAEILGNSYEYSIKEAIRYHISQLDFLPERVVANNMKKHIAYYLKGQPNQKHIKEKCFMCENVKDMLRIIDIAELK